MVDNGKKYKELNDLPMQVIFVPQGQEYGAVRRGLNQAQARLIRVIPIAIGNSGFSQQFQSQLDQLPNLPSRVLLLGLCGSLAAELGVGDGLIYQTCQNQDVPGKCLEGDRYLNEWLIQRLQFQVKLGRGLTCDRLITLAKTKQDLGSAYQAATVDMESYQVIEALQQRGIGVAVLRVVSDGIDHDLPELSEALDHGNLIPHKLAIAMLKQPIRSVRFSLNALLGLKKLQALTRQIFTEE